MEAFTNLRLFSFIPEKSRILKEGKIMKTKLLLLLLGNLMASGVLFADDRKGSDDREGGRPDFRRPPHNPEGGDRGGPRPDGAGNDERALQELQRRDAMIENWQQQLGRINQQNAEMRRLLQLFERRLSDRPLC